MSEKIKQEIKETVNKLANANLNFTIEDELEFAKVAVKTAEQELEQVKQENNRLLEIINAKPLETVDMDSAFEIEKLKEQLKAKEHELIMIKADLCRGCQYRNDYKNIQTTFQAKEQECEKLKKQYNCYACGTCNGKEDYKNMQRHCEKAIAQNHKYIQALDEISEIAKNDCENCCECTTELNLKECCSIYEIQNIITKAKDDVMTTNRDILNKMTNEELAKVLAVTNCRFCIHDDNCSPTKSCRGGILQWLKQECKGQ